VPSPAVSEKLEDVHAAEISAFYEKEMGLWDYPAGNSR
jgi:hypothetical protein